MEHVQLMKNLMRQNKYDTRNNKIKIKFRTKLTTVELVI
jgi:hypothetical protein